MMKKLLLAGVATAFVATPAFAQTVGGSLTFNNNISTSVVTNSTYNQAVGLFGTVEVEGTVDVDSAATAITDNKQINVDQGVLIGATDEEDEDGDGMMATVNSTSTSSINANGSVGSNTAVGWYNQQANVATIAVSSGGRRDNGEEAGGMATANTTSLQYLAGTYHIGQDEDDDDDTSVRTRNSVSGGAITGAGNIGSNGAAGAFNQQQNLMTISVASDASLANATTGLIQANTGNFAMAADAGNFVVGGAISGAGNIHQNLAAGVGNQQTNSLTVAASGAFGGNGTGGRGNGGL